MAKNAKTVDIASGEETTKVEEKEINSQEILNNIKEGTQQFTELDDDQRDVLVHDFNEKNKGVASLSTEKPDQEFIDMCKKDFEDYQSEYLSINYQVTTKEHALEYAKWLKDWNENHAILPSSYWIGALKFDEVIDGLIETLLKNPDDDLTFDYGALTYTYNLMMSPMGVGIKYAKWMAENQETYNAILNKLGEHVDMVALIKKKIGLLQSRWALACNGFKMEILLQNLEDYKNIDLSGI